LDVSYDSLSSSQCLSDQAGYRFTVASSVFLLCISLIVYLLNQVSFDIASSSSLFGRNATPEVAKVKPNQGKSSGIHPFHTAKLSRDLVNLLHGRLDLTDFTFSIDKAQKERLVHNSIHELIAARDGEERRRAQLKSDEVKLYKQTASKQEMSDRDTQSSKLQVNDEFSRRQPSEIESSQQQEDFARRNQSDLPADDIQADERTSDQLPQRAIEEDDFSNETQHDLPDYTSTANSFESILNSPPGLDFARRTILESNEGNSNSDIPATSFSLFQNNLDFGARNSNWYGFNSQGSIQDRELWEELEGLDSHIVEGIQDIIIPENESALLSNKSLLSETINLSDLLTEEGGEYQADDFQQIQWQQMNNLFSQLAHKDQSFFGPGSFFEDDLENDDDDQLLSLPLELDDENED
jgi:hypothetical protein